MESVCLKMRKIIEARKTPGNFQGFPNDFPSSRRHLDYRANSIARLGKRLDADRMKGDQDVNTNNLRIKLALVVGLSIAIGFGATVHAATTKILAVGTVPHSAFFDGPATVTVRTLTIAPGEVLAWHYHPGYAFNVVNRGALTLEDGCGGEETLTAGQAFEEVDGRVHRAKNLGAEDVQVYNTFIVPEGDPTTVNIPNNERLCGPPIIDSECRADGWMNFTYPHSFTNQGDCIQYVIHRPRTVVPLP